MMQVWASNVEAEQPHNPYSELLLLQHHSDIVRLLLKIDDRRYNFCIQQFCLS